MTKRLTHRLTYSAPLEAVAAMLRDPAFRERVCDAQHALRRTVSVDLQGAATVVRVDRVELARNLPPVATKLVGPEIEIVQTETWHDHERADYAVTIPGKGVSRPSPSTSRCGSASPWSAASSRGWSTT